MELPVGMCLYCAGDDRHEPECPEVTNWWVVLPGCSYGCDECGELLVQGMDFRILPPLQQYRNQPREKDRLICQVCATLFVIMYRPLEGRAG